MRDNAGLQMFNCHVLFLREITILPGRGRDHHELTSFDGMNDRSSSRQRRELTLPLPGRKWCRRNTHPSQSLHQRCLQKFTAASTPVTMFNRGGCLHQTNRQKTEHAHRHQTAIQRPERETQHPLFPFDARHKNSQTNQHETNTQHSINSEQRGVSVQRCRIQSLHVVEGNRWVDHETEKSRTNHIPESH